MNVDTYSIKTATRDKLLGLLMVLAGTTLFSLKAIFIKMVYEYGVTADLVIALRMVFAFPFYLLITIAAKRSYGKAIPAKTLLLTSVFGITGYYLASVFDLYGLQYISASLERIILYIYPSLVLLLSVIVFKQPIRFAQLISIAISYCGLLVVFMQDLRLQGMGEAVPTLFGDIPALYLGSGMVVASALFFAIYLVGSEFIMRSLPSKLYTALAMLSASLAVAIHYMAQQPLAALLEQSLPVYALIVVIAVFCTVLPSFLLTAGIHRVGGTVAGGVGSMGPVFTLLLAAMLLGEVVTPMQLAGFAMVISGVVLMGKLKTERTNT